MPLRGKLLQQELLARYTSFRIGGPADFFFIPEDERDLIEGLAHCKKEGIRWFVLGNGSNILVSDDGIRGMVISLSSPFFRKIVFEGNTLTVGAGAKTGTVLHEAVERSFGGIEFLGAVPGTMGGVFFMNAGTYLGEIADAVLEVRFLDTDLVSRVLPKASLNFQYRKSIFQKNPWVIVEGKLALVPMVKNEAKSKVKAILDRRKKTQPLGIPSAGSAFQNPPGHSSWQLVEAAGLRGFSIGDAAVSDAHTNFVINKGNAKASEVFQLMRLIQEKVFQKTGILLEPEVRLVGEWQEDFLRDKK